MTEEELFHSALEIPSAERAAFLDQACAGNAALRAAVEALLAAHEAPESFLNQSQSPPYAQPLDVDLDATRDSAAAEDDKIAASGEQFFGPGGSRDPRDSQTVTVDDRLNPAAGVVISGRYTLQEKIGEGGTRPPMRWPVTCNAIWRTKRWKLGRRAGGTG